MLCVSDNQSVAGVDLLLRLRSWKSNYLSMDYERLDEILLLRYHKLALQNIEDIVFVSTDDVHHQ